MYQKLTYYLILGYFFLTCQNLNSKPNNVVECEEPIPVFTLGEKSNPTKSQREELCSCIWAKFPVNSWERATSEKAKNGEKISFLYERAFPSRFRDAFKNCGGFDL